MSGNLDVVRGGANVFQDLGLPNAALEQLRARLAAEILMTLDRRGLSVRKAAELTGFAAADFSRVRNVRLGRFTVDRLMTMLDRLDRQVTVTVRTRARMREATTAARA